MIFAEKQRDHIFLSANSFHLSSLRRFVILEGSICFSGCLHLSLQIQDLEFLLLSSLDDADLGKFVAAQTRLLLEDLRKCIESALTRDAEGIRENADSALERASRICNEVETADDGMIKDVRFAQRIKPLCGGASFFTVLFSN